MLSDAGMDSVAGSIYGDLCSIPSFEDDKVNNRTKKVTGKVSNSKVSGEKRKPKE